MPRTLPIALLLALALAPAAHGEEPRNPEEATIRQMVADQAEAWNRQDAKAWSKHFAPDADFVNIFGMVFQGRTEIEARHAAIFATIFKGSRTQVTIRRLVFPAPDLALVDTEHAVTGYSGLPPTVHPTGEPAALRTRMKYVMKKAHGQWTIIAGQNTDVKPPPKRVKQ